MFDPPPGDADMLGDAEHADVAPVRYSDLDIEDVGVVRARRPLPNAVPALAMAANAKLDIGARADYLVLFVRNHLAPGELERVYVEMITGDMPADAVERIARAVATWGTARPTQPSSRSAC
jgi:hypothetical protein